ncbi:MAG TPA: hypothetical protein VN828_04790 [Acidobacteriaceae bacterium]|nr:hypothetical protein [Acidobacteriaceae bacterium]
MNLLERYLQAVGQYLASASRQDVLAELRVNLQAEMDARAEEKEGPLTESEIAAILKAHGRPMLVAARYMPQQYLIGPEVFPFYLLTLRRTAPLVVVVYFVAHLASFLFSPTPGAFAASLAKSFLQLVPVLLISWTAITLTFAMIEYVHKQHGQGACWTEWDPSKLPSLEHAPKEKSPASRIADLVVHCLWMLYVFAVPRHPYLILGPGALFLTALSAGFAPVWRLFYISIIVLLLAQLAVKVVALARGKHRWEAPLRLLTNILGVVPTALLALTKVYFVPTSPAANLHTLAQINGWMNAGFRIVLVIVVLNLVWDSWQYFRRVVPTERLAF